MNGLKKCCILGLGMSLTLGATAQQSKDFSFALRVPKKSPSGIYPVAPSTDADFEWAVGYTPDSVSGKKETTPNPYPLAIVFKGVPFTDTLKGDVTVKFQYTSDVGFVTFSNGGVVLGNPWPTDAKVSAEIVEVTHNLGAEYRAVANFTGASFYASSTIAGGQTVANAVVGSINGQPVDISITNSGTASAFTQATQLISFEPTNTVSWIVNSSVVVANMRDINVRVAIKPSPKLRFIAIGGNR